MTAINRSALVEYSAAQMFDLVNDIEHYPRFMQGCVSAKVLSESDTEQVGQLRLALGGIGQQFTTRNMLFRPERIEMNLVEGDFSNFSATWTFDALTDSACKISLAMEFEFRSLILGLAAQGLFSASANNLVDALVQRAHEVYGDA